MGRNPDTKDDGSEEASDPAAHDRGMEGEANPRGLKALAAIRLFGPSGMGG